MLTEEEITIIESTWAKVALISDKAAELFYARLFELDPSLRPLFKGSMAEQGRKLMQMIGTAVAHLRDLGTVVPAVEALGRKHVGYGVQSEHYEVVGSALLWTLDRGLGTAFTPDARAAWTKVYGVLSKTMIDAAHAGASAPAQAG